MSNEFQLHQKVYNLSGQRVDEPGPFNNGRPKSSYSTGFPQPDSHPQQLNGKLRERSKYGTKQFTNGNRNSGNVGQGEGRFDARFKVLLLGDSGVGKTSILKSLMGDAFQYTTISTIGIDLAKKIFCVENYRIQLEIWDTAGQEQYYSIVSLHFREAKAFIIVYDVTKLSSFQQIRKYWLSAVDKQTDEAIPVFFAANKADLATKRCVSVEQGQELASQQCAHGIAETSAKTGENVHELFQKVAEAMVASWGVPKRWYEQTDGNGATTNWSTEVSSSTSLEWDAPFQLKAKSGRPRRSTCCQTK